MTSTMTITATATTATTANPSTTNRASSASSPDASTSPSTRFQSPRHHRSASLVRATRGEWIKFRSVRSTVWTMVIAGIVTVGFGMIFSATVSSGEATGPAAGLTDPIEVALGAINLTQMIVGVLGVLFVASEYSTGLIRTTIAAVGRRLTVLEAKSIVLGATTAAMAAASATLALWLGQAVYSGNDATVAMTDPDLIGVILGATTYLTGIALIGLALGVIFRSTAGAIGVLVGGVFIGPNLLRLLPDSITDVVLKYLPSEAGSAMMSRVSDPELLSTGAAYAVFAAWVIGLLAVAGVLLRTRDA